MKNNNSKYVIIKNEAGEFVQEHRHIMEKHLGRKLKKTEMAHSALHPSRDRFLTKEEIIIEIINFPDWYYLPTLIKEEF